MNPLHSGFRALSRCTFFLAFVFAAGTFVARAQTKPVALKTTDISVFAGWQNLHPDYAVERNNGFVIGADITRYLPSRIDPSLEVRFSRTPGKYLNETSYQAGLRLQTDFKRFHPYGDFLGGVATVNFNRAYARPTYSKNTGGTFSVGGGVDFDIYRDLQLKVDYQQQYMYFDQAITLTPRPLSVGVTYRIPFKPRTANQ